MKNAADLVGVSWPASSRTYQFLSTVYKLRKAGIRDFLGWKERFIDWVAVLPLEMSLAIVCVNPNFPAKMEKLIRDHTWSTRGASTYLLRITWFKSVDIGSLLIQFILIVSQNAEKCIFECFWCRFKDSNHVNRIRLATNDINLDMIMPGGPTEATPF